MSGGGGGGFEGASLTELRAMIANTDPGALDTVAARWAAVDLALQQAQADLLQHTRAATAHWSGTAAEAFTARAEQLHRSLGDGAAYASHACSGVSYAADSLRVAREAMPPEPASLEGVVSVEQARETGTPASAVLEEQRKRAVAVMEQLEERYAMAARMIGMPIGHSSDHDLGVFVNPIAPASSHTESRQPASAGTTADANRQPKELESERQIQQHASAKLDSPLKYRPALSPAHASDTEIGANLARTAASGQSPTGYVNSQTIQQSHTGWHDFTPFRAESDGGFQDARRPFPHQKETSSLNPVIGRAERPAPQKCLRSSSRFSSPGSSSMAGRETSIPRTRPIEIPEVSGGSVSYRSYGRPEIAPNGTLSLNLSTSGGADNQVPLIDNGASFISGGARSGSKSRRSHRPEYLTEDPTTWNHPSKVNPSVIER